jgi:DNA-binding SARP family transcriptional activator
MLGRDRVSEPGGGASPAAACSEVRVLGSFQVLGGVPPAPMPACTGTPAQALKVLSVYRAVHAEELIEILWPECEAQRGRVRLRNVLARMRHAVGPVVHRESEVLLLDPAVQVDAVRFEADARAALRSSADDDVLRIGVDALEAYAGPLLPFDRYADWTVEPRERLRRRYLELLDRLAHVLARGGDHEHAIELLLTAIDEEPEADDRYMTAARLLLVVGRPGRALLVLRRLRDNAARWRLPLPPGLDELEAEIIS